jgi:hypothetical protein
MATIEKPYFKIFLFIVCISFLSGCHRSFFGEPFLKENSSLYDGSFVLLARFSDVPFPLGSKPRIFFEYDNKVALRFLFEGILDDLQKFYVEEMEQQGWIEVASLCSTQELVMCYNKPSKSVILVARPDQDSTSSVDKRRYNVSLSLCCKARINSASTVNEIVF